MDPGKVDKQNGFPDASAAHALRESESLYSALVEHSPTGMALLDEYGMIAYANNSFCNLVQADMSAAVLGRCYFDFVYPADRAESSLRLIRSIADLAAPLREHRLTGLQGSTIVVESCGVPVTYRDRPHVMGFFRDITQRKLAEREVLRKAEIQAVLREIAEASILASDVDALYRIVHKLLGRVLSARLFHVNLLEEATGDIIVPYNGDSVTIIPPRRPAGGGLTEYVMELGRAVYISPEAMDRLASAGIYTLGKFLNMKKRHYLAAPLIDSRGRIFGTMALTVLEDEELFKPGDEEVLSIIAAQVSMAIEQKQAGERLRLSEEKFAKAFNTGAVAMAIVSQRQRTFLEINDALTAVTGYSREKILGSTPLELGIYGNETERQKLLNMLARNGSVRNVEIRIRTRGGQLRTVLIATDPIAISGEDCWLIAAVDITERKQLQDQVAAEVALAGVIQSSMLQDDFSCEAAEVRTLYRPYHGVSGDYYDFRFTQGLEHLLGYVLDVTGHGMAAALQTTAIGVLLDRMMEGVGELSDAMLEQLNREAVPYFSEGAYAAILMFDFDFTKGMLRCFSGGINRFLARTGDVSGSITLPGSFIGLLESPEFYCKSMPFRSGDEFYFITDGVAELLEPGIMDQYQSYEELTAELTALANSERRWDDCAGIFVKIKGRVREEGRRAWVSE